MSDDLELDGARGFVAPEVAAEFPGLRLSWVTVQSGPRPTPWAVKQQLRALANRYLGAGVVAMRTQPIPQAYRVFFRQIGLDPDVNRIPSEEIALGRLLHGGLRSEGLPIDALRIALVETGVPVWALDADQVEPGGLGIRLTAGDEPFGSERLAPGQLVVADADSVHALLFGALAPGHGVHRGTSRMALFTVGVEGVPDIHLEEALWTCGNMLSAR